MSASESWDRIESLLEAANRRYSGENRTDFMDGLKAGLKLALQKIEGVAAEERKFEELSKR